MLGAVVFAVTTVVVRTTAVAVVLTQLTIVAGTTGGITSKPGAKIIRIDVGTVAVEGVVLSVLRTMLGVDTSSSSRIGTLAIAGVVTASSTLNGVPLVEHTVGTAVIRFPIRALVRVGGTSVAVAVGAAILTVLGVVPLVGGTSKHIITNTLHIAIGTGQHTLAILTVVVVVATAILVAGPGVLGAVVLAVTAVVVRAAAVTVVLTQLTIVASSCLRVTTVCTAIAV